MGEAMTAGGPGAGTGWPAARLSVLFVDDDSRVLDGLRRSLRSMRNEWALRFCTDGELALDGLASSPCDVVVSDMRMPGMDGAELLSRISRSAPGVVRVVLSGHTEPEAGVRAALVGHRFLSKPCDTDALIALVGQVAGHDGPVDAGVRAAAGGVCRLPVRAQQLHRLREVLAVRDATQATVVDAVTDSITVAAKVLQLANSRFFGPGTPVVSVADAVTALGVPFVRSLLDTDPGLWVVPDAAPRALVDAVYRHSVASARLAGRLATAEDAPASEVAGLLQGVGWLAGATTAPPYGPGPLGTGLSADTVGDDLLRLWGMPETVVRAVADKHTVHRPGQGLLGVGGTLRAARLLLQVTGCADPHGSAHPEELDELLAHPQLVAGGADWRAEAHLLAAQVVQDLG